MEDHIYLGIKGHVVCISTADGSERWRTKLRGRHGLTTLVIGADTLYACAHGHLYALAANTGTILWTNRLRGLGYGPCIIASHEYQNAVLAAAQSQQAQQAATIASIQSTQQAWSSHGPP